jgi:HK97 family phage portal protein
LRPATVERGLPGQFPWRPIPYNTGGVYVDQDTSMRHDAVWACRTRIAQDISMMPVDVVRYMNGARSEVPAPQIIASPSVKAAAMDWRYQVVDSWLAAGNAWGMVTATTMNGLYPTRIELLSPSQIRFDRTTSQFFVDNVEHQLWPVGQLWHVPAYTAPGAILGMSPIEYHATSIGVGMASQRYGAQFFDGGGHPTGILAPSINPGEEGAKALKDRFVEAIRGGREPIVVPADTKYIPIQTNPSDSQFLETMRYSVEQICRIFGEDPADYGSSASGSSLTYANRSDSDLARFKRRQFWVTKLQDALTALVPHGQVVKLNASSSLMMTDRERHELHRLRLLSKTRTINEVRVLEDEVPFDEPEYDEPGIPGVSEHNPTGDMPALVPRSVEPAVEVRSIGESRVHQHDTHIHLPDNLQVEMRQEPVVIPAPIVNVPAPIVNVNVEPTPVNVEAPNVNVESPTVNVAAPNVNVESPAPVVHIAESGKRTVKFKRNTSGEITGAEVTES